MTDAVLVIEESGMFLEKNSFSDILFCDGCVNYYYYYYFPHHIFDISTPTFVFFEPGLR